MLRKVTILSAFVLALSVLGFAQSEKKIFIKSETMLEGKLEGTLDATKAKPGDQVVLKVSKAVKQNGEVVIPSGSKVIGRVTEVKKMSREDNTSKICVLFDRIEGKNLTIPIQAEIVSIVAASSRAMADDTMTADTFINSSSSARVSSSGGGLLGGVTNTVGGVVNTSTQTATDIVGATTNTVGKTVDAVGNTVSNTVSNIQISQSAEASAEGSSVLSLNGGNIRLEKGTTFKLKVSESVRKQ